MTKKKMIFALPKTNKGLLSGIHRNLLKSRRQIQETNRNQAMNINRHFIGIS